MFQHSIRIHVIPVLPQFEIVVVWILSIYVLVTIKFVNDEKINKIFWDRRKKYKQSLFRNFDQSYKI